MGDAGNTRRALIEQERPQSRNLYPSDRVVEEPGTGVALFDFGEIAFLFDELTTLGDDGRAVAKYLIRTLRERVLEYCQEAEHADGETCWQTMEYGVWPGKVGERIILADFFGYADEAEGVDRELYVSRRSARLRGDPTPGAQGPQGETVTLQDPL